MRIVVALVMLLASAAHAGESRILALVIGNNRSLAATRPDLRYADDDALKYGLLFARVAHADDVVVLTRPDTDTAPLFSTSTPVTAAPTRAAVDAAVLALRARARAAAAKGERAILFVTFAGHGDHRRGQGFLELEDGVLDRDALRTVVEGVGAPEAHLILDACNSFFAVYPRRAGGRAWATSMDAGLAFEAKGTDVGVFLSTSEEGEVFEWSALESGLFSHAVRSGLAGIADVDADGRITYAELSAFVDTATRRIAGTTFRPRLFWRAPSQEQPLLDLRATTLAGVGRVQLDNLPGRATLRDARGIRLIDASLEDGFAPQVLLLGDAPHVLTADDGKRGAKRRVGIEAGSRLSGADLADSDDAARGELPWLAEVFREPFGPARFHAVQRERASAAPVVFGLSASEQARLVGQLEIIAARRRDERAAAAVLGGALSAGAEAWVIAGSLALQPKDPAELALPLAIGTGLAVLPFVAVSVPALLPSAEERALDELAGPEEDPALRLARATRVVDDLANEADAARTWRFVSAAGLAGGGGVAMLLAAGAVQGTSSIDPDDPVSNALQLHFIGALAATGLALLGAAGAVALRPTDAESMAALVEETAREAGADR